MNALFAQQPGQLTPQQQQQLNDEIAKISYGPIGIAGNVLGLVLLVLLILIIIKMFQNNNSTLGIVTIITTLCCGVGQFVALVVGWIKSGEWNIKPLMMIYTVVLLIHHGILGYMIYQIVSLIFAFAPK